MRTVEGEARNKEFFIPRFAFRLAPSFAFLANRTFLCENSLAVETF